MNGIFNRDYDEDTINVELIDIMTYYLAKPWLNEDEDFITTDTGGNLLLWKY